MPCSRAAGSCSSSHCRGWGGSGTPRRWGMSMARPIPPGLPGRGRGCPTRSAISPNGPMSSSRSRRGCCGVRPTMTATGAASCAPTVSLMITVTAIVYAVSARPGPTAHRVVGVHESVAAHRGSGGDGAGLRHLGPRGWFSWRVVAGRSSLPVAWIAWMLARVRSSALIPMTSSTRSPRVCRGRRDDRQDPRVQGW